MWIKWTKRLSKGFKGAMSEPKHLKLCTWQSSDEKRVRHWVASAWEFCSAGPSHHHCFAVWSLFLTQRKSTEFSFVCLLPFNPSERCRTQVERWHITYTVCSMGIHVYGANITVWKQNVHKLRLTSRRWLSGYEKQRCRRKKKKCGRLRLSGLVNVGTAVRCVSSRGFR